MTAASPRSVRVALGVMLVAAAVLLSAVGLPLWRPLLVAAVLAGTMVRWCDRAAVRLGGRRTLAAALFTLGTVLLILLPVAALALVTVREALGAVATVREIIASSGVSGLIARAPDPLEGWLRSLQQHLPEQLDGVRAQMTSGGRWALATLSGTVAALAQLAFQLAMMLIALFFLLRDGKALMRWLGKVTPLPAARVRELGEELRQVVRSVVGANLITGAVQAAVATGGYLIARAPSPVFFGLLTLFASLIPSVGTALVTFPVAGILLLMGHQWAALFLALWSLVVVGLIDNLLRPALIKGGVELHGALVFFSLMGGIATFGGIGLFVGPLALTFFLAAVRIARRAPAPPAVAAEVAASASKSSESSEPGAAGA